VNDGQDTFEILIDLMIPESQHSKSLRCERLIAVSIDLRMWVEIVLSAITFNNQPML
jgi:hypothetical protein